MLRTGFVSRMVLTITIIRAVVHNVILLIVWGVGRTGSNGVGIITKGRIGVELNSNFLIHGMFLAAYAHLSCSRNLHATSKNDEKGAFCSH